MQSLRILTTLSVKCLRDLTHIVLVVVFRFVFNANILPKKPTTPYPPKPLHGIRGSILPTNKTHKGNPGPRCLTPHLLSYLMPNQVGPAPPFFELSFRRLPFKDTSQDPGGQREREWRVQRKATLTSLVPLVLRLQFVPRPR